MRGRPCPYGDRCKHDHSVTLADAGIDASVTRSGSMPALLRQPLDRAALSTPRGFKALPLHRVAFVLVDGAVAFDAESTRAWDRFVGVTSHPAEL